MTVAADAGPGRIIRTRVVWPDVGPRARRRLTRVAVVVGALATWSLAARVDLASDQALPGTGEVLLRLVERLGSTELWVALGQTMVGWSLSLGMGILIAVPLGILLGVSEFAYASSRFVVDFLRTIPALGLIPLAALMFGATRSTELVIVVPACVWPLLLQVVYGVRNADPVARETARSYRLGRLRTLRHVVLPGALPFAATGLRLAAIIGMLLAISIELLVLVPGLGRLIAIAQRNGEIVDVYAYTLVAGFVGLGVVLAFGLLERRLIHWHPSQRGRS